MRVNDPTHGIDYDDCYEFIDNYCRIKRKLPYGANWVQAYDHLYRHGKIDMSKEEEKRISSKIKTEFVGRHKEEEYDNACKKEYIKEYFEMKYEIERTNLIN